ncbi:MAG: CotH kinase family protein [Bacteroidota bacterium]
MLKKIFSVSFLFFITHFHSQTFTSVANDSIYDVTATEYTLDVAGLTQNLDTANFGLETVCINLEHTYIADLTISLISPDGTSFALVSGFGGDSDFYTNTCFSGSSNNAISQSSSPFSGVFKPYGQMGLVNNNQDGNGTWTLRIEDNGALDVGILLDWSLTFGNNPANIFSIHESDLPIFMLETNSQEIPNEPKLAASVKVIYNGEGLRNFVNQTDFHFNGNCGVEIRGASSSNFPKKSYDLEIRDNLGVDLDTALLGLPSESDWVLSAQYTDKTLLRNMFSMHLIQEMDWYAPRFKPVELFINNSYQGVYILMEKVKKGANRVDISTLNPTEISGDDLTGGYILKIDKNSGSTNLGWESPFAPIPDGSPTVIDFYYPKGEDIVPEQSAYIEDYVTDFETALASSNFMDLNLGYRSFVNYESCVDALIISELSRSIDAYRKSFYLYKDKESLGGKLVMAPIWDYDLTYGNADFCEGQNPEGWQYNFNYVCGGDYWINPFWFPRMMEDTLFQQDLRCRWEKLRETKFHKDSLNLWIDNMASTLDESQNWNYTIWPTMGTYVWPNSFVGNSYQEEISFMKSWLNDRINWLDANIPGISEACIEPNLSVKKIVKSQIELYPNPVENELFVNLNENYKTFSIEIKDVLGKLIHSQKNLQKLNSKQICIKNLDFKSGFYLVEIQSDDSIFTTRFFKK